MNRDDTRIEMWSFHYHFNVNKNVRGLHLSKCPSQLIRTSNEQETSKDLQCGYSCRECAAFHRSVQNEEYKTVFSRICCRTRIRRPAASRGVVAPLSGRGLRHQRAPGRRTA